MRSEATADTFFWARSEATRSNARSAEQKRLTNRGSSSQAGVLNEATAERFSPMHLLDRRPDGQPRMLYAGGTETETGRHGIRGCLEDEFCEVDTIDAWE